MVKNCDRGLENAARGRSRPRSQFFTIRTDPKPANINVYYLPAVNWFCLFAADHKWVCLCNFVIESAGALSTY